MSATNQVIANKRLKPDASSFHHMKCLKPNLSFNLVNIWPKTLDAVCLAEKQVIWGSQEDIPCK